MVTFGLWDSLPFAATTAPIQAHVGELDLHVPVELRSSFSEAVTSAGGQLALSEYLNQAHGFHDPTCSQYDEATAEEAWERALGAFEHGLTH